MVIGTRSFSQAFSFISAWLRCVTASLPSMR
jgi:hypothetical protein